MSPQVPGPMFDDYFSALASCCNSVIIDDGCLSTVGNDGSDCYVGQNSILRETGDMHATESSNVPTLDSGSCSNKSITWSDFMVSVDNDGSIECERMFSEGGTAEASVGVSESKILVELENRKAWQPLVVSQDCDLYLHQRAFPRTWGAGMQLCLWYLRNKGYGSCQECKNMCRFYCKYCIEKV